MHETEAYARIKREEEFWTAIKAQVDSARNFRRMKYGRRVTITTNGKDGCYGNNALGQGSVLLDEAVGKAVLDWLAAYFEDHAHMLITGHKTPDIDTSQACKI